MREVWFRRFKTRERVDILKTLILCILSILLKPKAAATADDATERIVLETRAMATAVKKTMHTVEVFDEKQFYLDEFRNHTLLFSIPDRELVREEALVQFAAIVRDLLLNDSRVIVLIGIADPQHGEQVMRRLQRRLSPLIFRDDTTPLFAPGRTRNAVFVALPPDVSSPGALSGVLSTIWNVLRRGPLFVGTLPGAELAGISALARDVAAHLRVHKWILVEPSGGFAGTDGNPISFLDQSLMNALLSAGEAEFHGLAARRTTLENVRQALEGGVASVNVCSLAGAAHELFTYNGSGTLFTLADYCTVQRLGIDDFEEVERLIERGQREGLLKIRSQAEITELLLHGYGANIGPHHLAGVCALTTEPYQSDNAGEVVGLYTITRFKGEGIGTRLIARLLADARQRDLDYVFAATTEEKAGLFFEREGFHRVDHAQTPAAKWQGYETDRKSRVATYRHELRSNG